MLLSQFLLTFHHTDSRWDFLFHRIAYDYSQTDWDGLHGHLRDNPLEDIFKLNVFAFAIEFSICTDVHIPHHNYQVKPH